MFLSFYDVYIYLVDVFELDDGHNRAKDFFLANGHVVLHFSKHSGLHKVSVAQRERERERERQNAMSSLSENEMCDVSYFLSFFVCWVLPLVSSSVAATEQLGSFLLSRFNVVNNSIELQLGNLTATTNIIKQ